MLHAIPLEVPSTPGSTRRCRTCSLSTSKMSRRGTAELSGGAADAATLGTAWAASFSADTPASESAAVAAAATTSGGVGSIAQLTPQDASPMQATIVWIIPTRATPRPPEQTTTDDEGRNRMAGRARPVNPG